MQRTGLRIGDSLRMDGDFDVVRNPYDGTAVGEVCVGTAADMDEAIATVTDAAAAMRALPTHARVSIANGVAARIEAEAESLARQITAEGGKPITFARAEVARAQVTFGLAAAQAQATRGEVLPIDLTAAAQGRLCLHVRVPRGPVAAIAPFNFPLNLIAHKLAPAVGVGAPVVLKPPPQCPLTGLRLTELLIDAGLPASAVAAMHCSPAVAQRMVEDPRMKVLSFTGSDTVGWRLKALAGRKQVMLELGGNAPCLVDRGVDPASVLPRVMQGAWGHAGQVCVKVQRILVHRDDAESFLAEFTARTLQLPVGDPMDPATVVGPMIDEAAAQRVVGWVDEAVAAGATRHCGGRVQGAVVWPTILSDVPHTAKVVAQEVFGPVTVVEAYDDFDDALAVCNAGRFGLQAGVFTPDIGRALRAFEALDYGGVMINEVPTFRVDNFPYGGTKDSGFGREGVRFAMDEMTESKVLVMGGLG